MKAIHTVAVVAALAASQAFGACNYPAEPDALPDGSTASRDDMLAAKKKVQAFDQAIGEYTECLKKENEAAMADGADLTEDQKKDMMKMLEQKHNAAVEADEALAARFNEQLRAYNAKNKK